MVSQVDWGAIQVALTAHVLSPPRLAILHYRTPLASDSDCNPLALLNSPILNFPTEITFSTQHAHAADELPETLSALHVRELVR